MEFKDYYQTMGVKRDATQDEIKRVYRQLARTEGKAEALALAQRELLHWPSPGSYRNPYYWAGFVVVGNAD